MLCHFSLLRIGQLSQFSLSVGKESKILGFGIRNTFGMQDISSLMEASLGIHRMLNSQRYFLMHSLCRPYALNIGAINR